ncbi:MAG: von Willebrand factor type A domain-containing protein [Pseudomonadota bacterium]
MFLVLGAGAGAGGGCAGSGSDSLGGSPPGNSPPQGSGGSSGVGSGSSRTGVNPGTGVSSGSALPGSGGASSGPATGSGGASFGSGGASAAGGASATLGGAAGTSPPHDMFVAVGTNPFVATRHDPFSTFAADVDTASYDIFRRDVNQGALPQPASVRLEEYVNDFSYEYPAPTSTSPHPFQISLGAARNVFERGTTLLRVGIQATKPAPFQKRPANVAFLIDVSGSMAAADRLPLAQRVVVNALSTLDPNDKVSIVTYSNEALVRLPPTPASQRASITAVVNGLVANGSTAGAAALDLAYAQVQAGHIEGGINHVILCTDGDFNVGPSSTKDLLALIKSKRATGVTLTALGFGTGNLNDQMMEAVSNAGNGIYAVISSATNADRYVSERFLDTLIHVAKDMKIQVEFNPQRVTAYRLLGYEDRAIADVDFRNDVVDAGEVGAGHRVTALYELVLAGTTLNLKAEQPAMKDGPDSDLAREVPPQDLVLVKVRYKSVDALDTTPAKEVSVSFGPADLKETLRDCDDDLRWAAAVAAFAEILKQSPFADRAFLPQITDIVAAQATRDTDRQEFATLFAKAKTLLGVK